MWYIIPHTKTKIIAHVHTCTRHAGTHADFLFGMYKLETRFARINCGIFTMKEDHSNSKIANEEEIEYQEINSLYVGIVKEADSVKYADERAEAT